MELRYRDAINNATTELCQAIGIIRSDRVHDHRIACRMATLATLAQAYC
jgi:hypothetical protein